MKINLRLIVISIFSQSNLTNSFPFCFLCNQYFIPFYIFKLNKDGDFVNLLDSKFLSSSNSASMSQNQAGHGIIMPESRDEKENEINYTLDEKIHFDHGYKRMNNNEKININENIRKEDDNIYNNNNNNNSNNKDNNDNHDNNEEKKNEIKTSNNSLINHQFSKQSLPSQNNSNDNILELLIKSENPLLTLYEVSFIFIVFIITICFLCVFYLFSLLF